MELINRARAQARTDAVWNFFSRNLKTVKCVAVIAAVVVVAFVIYSIYSRSMDEKYSTILHQSLISQQIGEIEKARNQLKSIVDSSLAPNGVKSIASLRYAAFLLEEGKKEEAQKIYADVNDCNFCDDYTTDLAGLLLVRLWMLDEVEMQKDDFADKIKKVEGKSGVLKNHIAEQRAILELYKNHAKEAYEIYEKIAKDSNTSQVLRARAESGMKMAEARGFKVEEKK